MLEPVTERQSEVLDFYRQHIREHGKAPTVKHMAASLNMSHARGTQHVNALVRKGRLKPLKHSRFGTNRYDYEVVDEIKPPSPLENFTVLNQQARCDCCNTAAARVIAYTDSEYANYICQGCVEQWLAAFKTCDKSFGPAGDGAPDTIPPENSH